MLLYVQEVPEKTKESHGAPWQFVGLLSLFDPPRHDSAETIRRALNLGVNVKMITGKCNIHHRGYAAVLKPQIVSSEFIPQSILFL